MERVIYIWVKDKAIHAKEEPFISTPLTERDIDIAVKAVDNSLRELKPYVERIWPDIIG